MERFIVPCHVLMKCDGWWEMCFKKMRKFLYIRKSSQNHSVSSETVSVDRALLALSLTCFGAVGIFILLLFPGSTAHVIKPKIKPRQNETVSSTLESD